MVYLVVMWSGERFHKPFSSYKEMNAYWVEHKAEIKKIERKI